jgi:hypothetical protein
MSNDPEIVAEYIRNIGHNAQLMEDLTYWKHLFDAEHECAGLLGQELARLEAENGHLTAEVAEMRGAIEWQQYKVGQQRVRELEAEAQLQHQIITAYRQKLPEVEAELLVLRREIERLRTQELIKAL